VAKNRKAFYLNISENLEQHQVDVDGKRVQEELSQILQLNESLHPTTRGILGSVQSILPLVEDTQAPTLRKSVQDFWVLNLSWTRNIVGS
jgi:hypothetical protein